MGEYRRGYYYLKYNIAIMYLGDISGGFLIANISFPDIKK